jgi:hypothetical protein
MRKLLLAALLAVIPSIAYAQTGYVEGSVGFVLMPDVETDDYSIFTPQGELFQGNAEADYDANWAFGAEAGFRVGPWRFGASWDFIDSEVNTARLEGTLDGVPFSFEASDQDLEDFGIDANNDVNIFAANAYYMFGSYSLGGLGMGVQPYVGLGAGVATFDNLSSEFAFLVTLGANVPIGERAYIGGRYRLALISGPEAEDTGIEFDGITTHTFSLVLGFQFGG